MAIGIGNDGEGDFCVRYLVDVRDPLIVRGEVIRALLPGQIEMGWVLM
jgi:hypothetical protein